MKKICLDIEVTEYTAWLNSNQDFGFSLYVITNFGSLVGFEVWSFWVREF